MFPSFQRDPLIYSKFALPTNMRIVLATPPISILTEDARKIIPSHVELSKTVNNIGDYNDKAKEKKKIISFFVISFIIFFNYLGLGYSGLVIAGIVKV